MGVFKRFNNATSLSLDETPNVEEIKKAVWSCYPNKALGYDGFNIRYIKSMWDTVGNDIV